MNKAQYKALVKATSRSTHKKHQNGTVIVNKRGRIVSSGCAHASELRWKSSNSIHAEMHALGLARYEDLRGAIAYNMTIARKSGNIVNSKPCINCAIALRAAGITVVKYTIGSPPMFDPMFGDLYLDDELDNTGLKVYPERNEI